MFGIGFGEIIIIAMLALLLFGQDDLPANIRKAANGIKEFRKVTSNAQRAWHEVRSDMTRTLLEESDKEVNSKKQTQASVTVGGGAMVPDSALEMQPVDLLKVEDDLHHHHGHEADEHSHETKIHGATTANVVIRAPEGIIAHGMHLDDDANEVFDESTQKKTPKSGEPERPVDA